MKIATILSVHSNPELALDTLDSILYYMTKDILVLIDGCSKDFDFDMPVYKLKGFKHGVPKSPYKNVALGLKSILEIFPEHDWYCYLEYDCLVFSSDFINILEKAEDRNVWMLGCDGHVDDKNIPLVESILKEPLKNSYYLLGACQFFHKSFLKMLSELNFFDTFLGLTNGFSDGYMQGYTGYDVSEHLYPSLVRHFGGNIGVLSSWQEEKWHGNYEMFPIRWRPEIEQICPKASIIHPIKDYSHPIRKYGRKNRCQQKV